METADGFFIYLLYLFIWNIMLRRLVWKRGEGKGGVEYWRSRGRQIGEGSETVHRSPGC